MYLIRLGHKNLNFVMFGGDSDMGSMRIIGGGGPGHWNQVPRREDGYGFTREQRDEMFAKLPQPLVTAYQYKVREAVNPKRPCGSCDRTPTPSKIGA